ncbi:hypothetical protein [Clostridium sp.]|uniref:hypothetical protein n=1 Tax=Clostridium sp. TaxID=1506 RepID=UPI002606303D|nr:hypothetical protein [Clostridium sp.]
MDLSIDKVDINILYLLYINKNVSPLYSVQLSEIEEYIERTLSYSSVVRRTLKLLELGYLIEGYKVRRAQTFYLSEKGISFINENIISKENNIYNESED